jgi:1,4-alpha-glucan branching enzyme
MKSIVDAVTCRARWASICFALLFLIPCFVQAQQQLTDGQNVRGVIPRKADPWVHYYMDFHDWQAALDVRLDVRGASPTSKNTPRVFVRRGALPTRTQYDFLGTWDGTRFVVLANETSTPRIDSGRYYISVIGAVNSQYSLVARRLRSPSRFNGMGAKPYDNGTAFRVWAPFAEEVHVAGQFNDWNSISASLQSEGNGYWSLDHRNADPGDEYRYVIRRAGETHWRVDPYEEQITNSVGNSVIFDEQFEWTDGSFQMPTWNELVVYQMHVGTFNDAPGGRPGTLDSAIARLDYLQQLGVNAVELLPVHEFAGDYSWGYNPAHPFAVEEAYGGPVALKRFVDAAHARGIAVLGDVVHNHWGPSDLGTWRFDGWYQGDRGGIYFYQDNRADTPWGSTRPDFGRPEVRQYIRDHAITLLHDFHLDGLRWDSTLNIRNHSGGTLPEGWSLMQWINDEVNQQQPWKIMIAEDLQNDEWITRETGSGGAGYDSQWCSVFVHPLRNAIVPPDDNARDMFAVRNSVQNRLNGDSFRRVIYTESHDEVANGRSRVPEEIWPGNAGSWFSKKRSTLGAALVLTSPGIPMIFQGQEILEDEYFRDTDPVDWSKASTHAGIRLLYEDLIKLRRNWFNHTRGLRGQNLNFFHLKNNDKMVAFHRWDQGGAGDDVIVVCNFRDRTWNDYRIGLPRGGVWKVRFNSDWNGYSSDFGNFFSPDVSAENVAWDGLNFSGNIKIAPYSVLILSQD